MIDDIYDMYKNDNIPHHLKLKVLTEAFKKSKQTKQNRDYN